MGKWYTLIIIVKKRKMSRFSSYIFLFKFPPVKYYAPQYVVTFCRLYYFNAFPSAKALPTLCPISTYPLWIGSKLMRCIFSMSGLPSSAR